MTTQKNFVKITRQATQTIVYLAPSTNSIALPGHPSAEAIQEIAKRFPGGSPNRRAKMLAAFAADWQSLISAKTNVIETFK